MIMSYAFDVYTPVTDGTLALVLVAVYGNPVWVSNGLAQFAPDMLNATTESPFDESPLLNLTVIVIEPPAGKTAHHSERR
jgi:hypothetical protein